MGHTINAAHVDRGASLFTISLKFPDLLNIGLDVSLVFADVNWELFLLYLIVGMAIRFFDLWLSYFFVCYLSLQGGCVDNKGFLVTFADFILDKIWAWVQASIQNWDP